MKIQESAEDYLEAILMLAQKQGEVRSIDIVNWMEYSKPSISVAMKRLRQNGYIEMDPSGYITLTEAGRAIAERVYERHQVLSRMLMELGVSEETALKDACRMEHVLSQESFEKIRSHGEGTKRQNGHQA